MKSEDSSYVISNVGERCETCYDMNSQKATIIWGDCKNAFQIFCVCLKKRETDAQTS